MRKKVAIVTDTIGCISKEEIERYHICEVPIRIIFGDKVYRDRFDLSANEFYSMLENSERLPTTSAPSPEHFFEMFQKVSQEADQILCITLSSKLSSTYSSALIAAGMAKQQLPETTIEILDSRTAAASEGFVVTSAAESTAKGKELNEVIQAARDVIERVHLLAVVDTLRYLARGGRVPRVIAWASSMLDIKPILALRDGEAYPASRARTYQRAISHMLEMMKSRITGGTPLHVAVMHAAVPERAEELKEQISSMYDCQELKVTEFTPVMGAHTGPGLIGVAFYNEKERITAAISREQD